MNCRILSTCPAARLQSYPAIPGMLAGIPRGHDIEHRYLQWSLKKLFVGFPVTGHDITVHEQSVHSWLLRLSNARRYRPKSGVKVNPSEHTGIQAIWLILRDSIVCAFNLHAGNSIRGFANQSFVKQGAVSFH
ncbi:hypothetical protein TWF217_004861 [Orbilia oligospora]|nr:hypothetical protein TWF751_007303 [Orbilia oligospora]KAF3260280.1 hypothetical protein TWF217_004861 [Orbilia oligospora]KAF3285648.1 hypothetical protein TWF132_009506 [Orbilia oligospora]